MSGSAVGTDPLLRSPPTLILLESLRHDVMVAEITFAPNLRVAWCIGRGRRIDARTADLVFPSFAASHVFTLAFAVRFSRAGVSLVSETRCRFSQLLSHTSLLAASRRITIELSSPVSPQREGLPVSRETSQSSAAVMFG